VFYVIGALVALVLWTAAKSPAATPAKVETLPPPDPVPYTAGQALLSPAMAPGSRMLAGANALRLQTRMVNPESGGAVAYQPRGVQGQPPQLPAAISGSMAPPAGPLPVVSQDAAQSLLTTRFDFRKV
jgi:hypothetical protein